LGVGFVEISLPETAWTQIEDGSLALSDEWKRIKTFLAEASTAIIADARCEPFGVIEALRDFHPDFGRNVKGRSTIIALQLKSIGWDQLFVWGATKRANNISGFFWCQT
jgi:hypothetical protein